MALKIKDSGLRLRVDRELRTEFVAACRAEGKTAASVLRECIRQFVDRARAGQQELFVGKGSARAEPHQRTTPGACEAEALPGFTEAIIVRATAT